MPGISLFGNCSRNLGSPWAAAAGLKVRAVAAEAAEEVVEEGPPAFAAQMFAIVRGIVGRLVAIVMVFQKD